MWCKVSCLRKQYDGRDWASNNRPFDLKSNALTTTPPHPHCNASKSKLYLTGNLYLALSIDTHTTVGLVRARSSVYNISESCGVSLSCSAAQNALVRTCKIYNYFIILSGMYN